MFVAKLGSPARARRGFALVVTLVVVALLTIIVTAFLTSATNDRLVSRAYLNRVRAEQAAEAGLAKALGTFRTPDLLGGFSFITTLNADGLPVLIPLKSDASLDSGRQRTLFSEQAGAQKATISLAQNVSKQVEFVTLNDANNSEVGRFAFLLDEAGSKQNAGVAGVSDRQYLQEPGQLPIVAKAGAAPVPLSSAQRTALKDKRPSVLTAATLNQVFPNELNPQAEDYYFTTSGRAVALTPDGKPRLNLEKLRRYIETLPVDQAAGNQRSKLVDRLLNPGETGNDWDGGNLSVLASLGRYTVTQQKQIVANLIDYLDSDVFPTTDDAAKPTYFGVEGKADADGSVRGHPYINFVGTGLIFNLSGASGNIGGLNSTRVLVFLGLVNPWSKETNSWSTFYADANSSLLPEIELTVEGSAAGGNQGSSASSYFKSTYSLADSSNELVSAPADKIAPRTGYSFPRGAAGLLYANFKDLLNTVGRQPPGMSFSGIHFKFQKLRLKYKDTTGRVGYVQILDRLGEIANTASMPDINLPSAAGSRIYKLTADSGGVKQDFHLRGDPRLNFLPGQWMASTSTANGDLPPNPTTAVNILGLADGDASDFPSSLAGPSDKTHLWYKDTVFSKHFYVKSPPAAYDDPPTSASVRFDSIGELGYLHTGIPWETLRFYVTDTDATGSTPKSNDRKLLAYVRPVVPESEVSALPTAPNETAPASPIPTVPLAINVNGSKLSTLQALFLGSTAINNTVATARALGAENDPEAGNLATALSGASGDRPFALPGDFLKVAGVRTVTNASADDFSRETLIRRTANAISVQSTRFFVYSYGEARDKLASRTLTVGKALLRAEIELRTDGSGKPVPVVVSKSFQ